MLKGLLLNQIRYQTIYYIENLHFILVSVLRNQFLRVVYVLSYVFFVCDVEVVGTENLMESIKLALLEVVSKNNVSLFLQVVTAVLQNFKQIYFRAAQIVDLTLEVEEQKAVDLQRLSFDAVVLDFYIFLGPCGVI